MRGSQYLIWDFIHQQLSAVTLRCIFKWSQEWRQCELLNAFWSVCMLFWCELTERWTDEMLLVLKRSTCVQWWNLLACWLKRSYVIFFVDVPVTLFIACHHFSAWKGVDVLNTVGTMKMCFVYEHFGFDENVLCLWTLWVRWICALFMNTGGTMKMCFVSVSAYSPP